MKASLLDDADAITRGARQMRAVCLGRPRTRAIRERLERQRRAREGECYVPPPVTPDDLRALEALMGSPLPASGGVHYGYRK